MLTNPTMLHIKSLYWSKTAESCKDKKKQPTMLSLKWHVNSPAQQIQTSFSPALLGS